MAEVTIIGIDLAKRSFQLHGSRADGSVAFRKKLSREKVLGFMALQPRCVVAMEACWSAHYWGREIGKLGHAVKLVPPVYVKPFVKRQKNDAADAEAICEAASRPTMRFVAVRRMWGGWPRRSKTLIRGCPTRSASWARCCSVRWLPSTNGSRGWRTHCVRGRAKTHRRCG